MVIIITMSHLLSEIDKNIKFDYSNEYDNFIQNNQHINESLVFENDADDLQNLKVYNNIL
ncbi:hypothetical protein [uncultured Clostridium sp.]|uniref:hypothetical protein n=1 Tax=uncultured Clostridium sp. TaxID=59620 RepID=UPI002636E98C|nr:hypothetical protein [uncultured Clostridium sp.]